MPINSNEIVWDDSPSNENEIIWDNNLQLKKNNYVPIPQPIPQTPAIRRDKVEPIARPLIEAGGMAVGGIVGAGAGPAGSLAGGTLGYAAGKKTSDILFDKQESQRTLPESLKQTGKDVQTGIMMEMAGPIIGKVAGVTAKGIAKYSKEVLGKTTGAGAGMLDVAAKGSKTFKSAMRGKISGLEIVDEAKLAVQELRDVRALEYQHQLAKVAKQQGNIDTSPIQNKFAQLLEKYNIKVDADGAFDLSRVAMGKSGRKDIKEIIALIAQHGSKEGDNTALGLDVLKRQLGDFYSDSSQARQFVSSLKNTINDTIGNSVPAYKTMTKGYAEATNLIKDIEAGLMLRKKGISGRIVADQSLRRLTSSMRENFELRRDLVKTLSGATQKELEEKIAGYSAQQIVPRGLVGHTSALALVAILKNSMLWPLVAISSPRAVGEFVNVFGPAMAKYAKLEPAATKTFTYSLMKEYEKTRKEKKK